MWFSLSLFKRYRFFPWNPQAQRIFFSYPNSSLFSRPEHRNLDRFPGSLDLRRDEGLHLGDVLFLEVRETLLRLQILLDRLLLFGDGLIGIFPLLPLVVRPHSGLARLLGDPDRLLGILDPTLGARE